MNAESKKTVLLVDDDPDFLLQEKTYLEKAGFEVTTAVNQREAEEALARFEPNLAVVDLMMETPDAGFTLCYHMRKQHPNLPVIMVTSVNQETGLEFDTATAAQRSWIKADAILSKPIRFEQLQREIDRLL
jgi:CheY-like chemotaxis protein